MEQGDITGDVNQLDISSLDYNNLEDCIARAVKNISHLDKKSKSLLQSARYVHLVRETAGSTTDKFLMKIKLARLKKTCPTYP